MRETNYSIHHDLNIDMPAEKVFQAISEPGHLQNWWPLKCSGRPSKGEEYQFYFTPEFNWQGEVVKSEADRAFHIKMTKSDEDWDSTTLGFDLDQQEGATHVRFSHAGWTERNSHFRQSSFCWAMLLNGLKNYVEKGVIVPFEERE